jgi:ribose 5-phosphate isomerase B
MKTIGIANDHAGYELKLKIITFLKDKGYQVKDFGSESTESVDYPDYAHPLANAVERGMCVFGISICGSGNGINMTVNKHAGIRGALCWLPEISRLARAHNDANICSLPARFISEETACRIVDEFLNTAFDGGRHQRRVDKIRTANK